MIEALTGSWDAFGCMQLERTADNGATYDRGYYRPYQRPDLESPQRDDGILDRYAATLRFGLATFDAWDTYRGSGPLVLVEDFDFDASATVDGVWSYGSLLPSGPRLREDGHAAGSFLYPGCPGDYQIDTGVRHPDAPLGGLKHAHHRSDSSQVNARIQYELPRLRGWGGTPMAASLDDLHYYLTADPAGIDDGPGPTHVVVISDGAPDDDYREFHCDCLREGGAETMPACTEVSLAPVQVGVGRPHVLAAVGIRATEGDREEGLLLGALAVHVDGVEVPADAVVRQHLAIEQVHRRVDCGFPTDLLAKAHFLFSPLRTGSAPIKTCNQYAGFESDVVQASLFVIRIRFSSHC